jgi:hypothetical protein
MVQSLQLSRYFPFYYSVSFVSKRLLDFNLSAGKFPFAQPLFQPLRYSLSNLDYSQSVTITALENRREYKFPLTELIILMDPFR